jgi:hypothetical protein
MRRHAVAGPVAPRFVAPGCVLLSLVLALSYIFDDVNALGEHPAAVFWAIVMIGCVCEWFYVRRRDPTGTADRLGIMIGVLLWALGWALG